MKRLFSSLIVLGICLSPVTLTLSLQPSWGQAQDLQEQLQRLIEQAFQQTQQGNPLEAIETWQKILGIARQQRDKGNEAIALVGIGLNYANIGQPQKALDSYNLALSIFRAIKDRSWEAITLNNLGTVYDNIGQSQEALKYYNQALPIRREVGDPSGEATTLNNLGAVYDNIGQPQEALKYYNQALLILREVGDPSGEAATLNNLGLVYSNIGQPQEAIKYYNQALPIAREVRNRSGEAATLNNLGEVYRNIGQPQEALKYYNQALPILREVRNRSGEATTLVNLGTVYDNIGQPQEALKYYNQALPIVREVGNRSVEATTLTNLGVVYSNIGQPQEALKYYNQALPIHREVGNRSGEATTLNNLGAVYRNIGQLQEAEKYYNQALPIVREVENRSGEAATLTNLGLVYSNMGQPQKALKNFNQALPIRREVGDRSGEAITLNNLGEVYDNIGQPQEALKNFNQALPIFREVGNRSGEATTLNNLGLVYYSIGQLQEALKYYNQALPILREVGNRSVEVTTLSNLGAVYQDINQPSEAVKFLEEAIKITLEMRGGLSRKNRQAFLTDNQGTAIALTDLLIKQNQPDKAFEWINLATTSDLADYNRLIKARVANPQAQAALDSLNQKYQQLNFLRQQLQDNFTDDLAQRIRNLEAETFKETEAIINQFPEVAELLETNPTDIAQLQKAIPQDTLVIQPVLLTGIKNVPNTIAVFLLTRKELKVIQNPVNAEELEQLTQYPQQLANRFDTDYKATSRQLYDILIRPLEKEIEANSPKRLAIIATGKLRYIPFETLNDRETEQYLIEKYPIHYLTRISTRSPQNNVETLPITSLPTNRRILAFANPHPTKQELAGTEKEADYIKDNFPNSIIYKHQQATIETFKEEALNFPYLHLGTHGCFNQLGCAALGMEANTILFANNQQYPIADAALLGLNNTELIVLSACQTAKEINTEEQNIPGLAFVFERAGAKSIIASLWNAEDTASSDIMIQFYQNINQGMSKSEAMQGAKLSQIKRHPWFWSPFILVGDGQ